MLLFVSNVITNVILYITITILSAPCENIPSHAMVKCHGVFETGKPW